MPNTFASTKQYLGIAAETTPGTAVVPTATIPFTKFDPEDKPVWLDDKALRGSMAELYGKYQGVIKTDFSLSGPAYGDVTGYLLANILGDASVAGTYTGSGTTTLASSVTAGSTTISTVASISASTVITIDASPNSETRTVSSVTGSGPYTITLNKAVTYAHASSVVVQPVTTPYIRKFSLLNTGNGQGVTHTLSHFQGPPSGSGIRTYSSACLSELNLKFNAESSLLEYDAKGMSFPSAIAGASFAAAPSAVAPNPSWKAQLGVGGPASGGTLVATVLSGEFDIKRQLAPYFTVQNLQSPYIIQRGALSVAGKLTFISIDETPFLNMINNSQPQVQLLLTNGLSGANLVTYQIDLQMCAFTAAKYNAGKEAVEYDVSFEGVANTTNVGPSAGLSPVSVTLSNGVAAGQYSATL